MTCGRSERQTLFFGGSGAMVYWVEACRWGVVDRKGGRDGWGSSGGG